MEDFNTTKYWQDGVLYLENLKIQNCRLVSLQSEWVKKSLVMKKCVFEKVVFDNHCGRGLREEYRIIRFIICRLRM